MPDAAAGRRGAPPWGWYALALALVAADQATKALVLAQLAPGVQVPLAPFFNLVLVFNRGAAFSLLAGASGWQTPLLAAFSIAASAFIAVLLWRGAGGRLLRAALALVLGGALGNLVDRMRFGQVVDFLDFHALGWHWPAFNLADSCITVGAGLLIVEALLPRGAPPGDAGR